MFLYLSFTIKSIVEYLSLVPSTVFSSSVCVSSVDKTRQPEKQTTDIFLYFPGHVFFCLFVLKCDVSSATRSPGVDLCQCVVFPTGCVG